MVQMIMSSRRRGAARSSVIGTRMGFALIVSACGLLLWLAAGEVGRVYARELSGEARLSDGQGRSVAVPSPPAGREAPTARTDAGWGPVHGMYRAEWHREGKGPEADGMLTQELGLGWRGAGLSLNARWDRPLSGTGILGRSAARDDDVGLQLAWEGGRAEASVEPTGLWMRLRMRPPGSLDPFRLFYPESGERWDASYGLRVAGRLGSSPWEGEVHRARGSRREDEAVWGRIQGRTGADGRWRLIHVRGSRRQADAYTAWSLDGEWNAASGRWTAGYARRDAPDDGAPGGAYRAAGFIRWRSRRMGRWSLVAEGFRRDDGFRLPIGGDLPWKAGTQGARVRVQHTGRGWDGLIEEAWIGATASPSRLFTEPGDEDDGAQRESVYQLTWRPQRTWWLRVRHEGRLPEGRDRYDVQWRWVRHGVTVRGRWDREPERRRQWRAERVWGSRRIRLDWDERWAAWRAEYRQEWSRFGCRIVVKERDDPRAGGTESAPRQTFWFLEGSYRSPSGWRTAISMGWDDRGRIDYHWAKPVRWAWTWEITF